MSFISFGQEWSEPEKLPEPVNIAWRSSFPFITHDGKRLYFCSNRDFSSTEDIYYCDWDGEKWTNAVRLGSNINTLEIEQSPSVTADGKTLYFVRYTNKYSYDIYYSTWDDTGWGKAVNIGPPINTNNNEFTCCISAGGDTLIISCAHYRMEMYPDDLCMSVKTDTGWTWPELIFKEYEGNSSWEYAPSLSGDGKRIYFESPRFVSGERDIWYTEYINGIWCLPVNLGAPVNTAYAEMSPSISSNGKTLYFSRMYNKDSLHISSKIYESHLLPTNICKNTQKNNEIQTELTCYPNPFNVAVKIQCTLTHPQWLEIRIYNIQGKEVISLPGFQAQPGIITTVWDGTDNYGCKTSTGIYFCRVITNNQTVGVNKLLLLN